MVAKGTNFILFPDISMSLILLLAMGSKVTTVVTLPTFYLKFSVIWISRVQALAPDDLPFHHLRLRPLHLWVYLVLCLLNSKYRNIIWGQKH